jgi:hypothetical protein
MLERLETKMPSTSNAIECLNGHMNESTPRSNTFSDSLHRIGMIFTEKMTNIIEASASGVLKIIAQEGDAVPCGEPIAEIN